MDAPFKGWTQLYKTKKKRWNKNKNLFAGGSFPPQPWQRRVIRQQWRDTVKKCLQRRWDCLLTHYQILRKMFKIIKINLYNINIAWKTQFTTASNLFSGKKNRTIPVTTVPFTLYRHRSGKACPSDQAGGRLLGARFAVGLRYSKTSINDSGWGTDRNYPSRIEGAGGAKHYPLADCQSADVTLSYTPRLYWTVAQEFRQLKQE